MPIYCYKCSCGRALQVFSHHFNATKTTKCPYCMKRAKRDIAAEGVNTDCGDHERVSNAMGIAGDQLGLAMRTFPGSEYVPDGEGGYGLKIKNRAHKKVEMARRGYVEFE